MTKKDNNIDNNKKYMKLALIILLIIGLVYFLFQSQNNMLSEPLSMSPSIVFDDYDVLRNFL